MLKLGSSLVKGGASLLSFVKDNLKLYLDFKSTKSDTLKFPSEGSTEFSGSGQYIDCGDINDVDGASALSISAWIKCDVTSGTHPIVSKYLSSIVRTEFIVDSNLLYMVLGSAYYGYFSFTSTDWNHVAMVFDGSGTGNTERLKIYVNGESQTLTYVGTIPTTTLDIGTNVLKIGNRTSGYFNGKMANVAIWSRALTPEEVQSIMNKSYSQLKGVETTSLVSWWALDIAPDTLGNNLITNGTFDSDLSSWSTSSSHWQWDNGRAYAYSGSNYQFRTSSVISWTTGATYNVSFDIEWISGSSLNFYLDGTLITITSDTTSVNQNVVHTSGTGYFQIYNNGSVVYIDNIVVKELKIKDSESTNHGSVTGATTTTSVYGGNAPILPRAIDVAKEGQADAIGDGSASFVGSNTDYIVIENGKSPSYPFTLTAWVYPEIFNSHGTIYNAWVNESLWWGVYSHASLGKVRLHLVGGNDYIDTPNGSLSVNEWSHIATTWDGTNAKTYINGIAQTMILTGALAMPTAEGPPVIGMLSTNLSSNPYTGDIAQLGIFAGALTQAQIQSVMESTSYSKIPADVKSTLGSEIVTNGTFDSDISNWTDYRSARGDISYSNGRLRIDNTTGTGEYYVKQFASFESGKLYKIQFDLFLISGTETEGNFYFDDLDRFPLYKSTDKVGDTYTLYASPSINRSYFIIGGASGNAFGDIFELDNITIKEVTNDIVAYYPLDGSSSANGVTQDVTTGETLGSELALDGGFDTDVSAGNASDDWYIGPQTHEISNGRYRYTDGATGTLRLRQGGFNKALTLNKLHKLTFEIFDGNAKITIATNAETLISLTTYNIGTHTVYFIPTASHFAFDIKASSISPSFSMDSVSLKRVTSNTGVLK